MKLEVGMYVRTKNKGICKIEGFASTLTDDYIENEKGSLIPKDEITKASHNIIDLIEIGDYVNDYRVINLYDPTGNETLWIILSCNPLDRWKNEDIKSIVTKEQFEAMAYKIMN